MNEATDQSYWNDRYDWLFSVMEKHLERRDAARIVSYQKATWTLLTASAFIALSGVANNQQVREAVQSVSDGNVGYQQPRVLLFGLVLLISYACVFWHVILAYFPRKLRYPFGLLGRDGETGNPVSIEKDRNQSERFNRARWKTAVNEYFIPEGEFRAKILEEYILADTEHIVLIDKMTAYLKRAFVSMVVVATISLLFFFV